MVEESVFMYHVMGGKCELWLQLWAFIKRYDDEAIIMDDFNVMEEPD